MKPAAAFYYSQAPDRTWGTAGPFKRLPGPQSAFTMVEIALSIAVVAFGMVAILGILPIGHQVQKDNREDTIIDQDGKYFLEAISSGSQGLTELSNYVEAITIKMGNANPITYSNLVGRQIVGLLSTPKVLPGSTNINLISARVRAISGSAAEKGLGTHPDLAFRYSLSSEIIPFNSAFVSLRQSNPIDSNQVSRLRDNLHEIRLTFRWPVLPNGTNTGSGRRSFSTSVSGVQFSNQFGYFFQPYSYR